MGKPEYKTIMVADFRIFNQQVNELSELGFVAVSSNAVLSTIDDDSDYFYFALMVRNPVGDIIVKTDYFQNRILEELNEIKYELNNLRNSVK